jgi:hypothetical protein
MADPAQAFLDSGGDSAHPLSSEAAAANDPSVSSDPAQAYLETGGDSTHPLKAKPKEKDTSSIFDIGGGFTRLGHKALDIAGGVAHGAGTLVDVARNDVRAFQNKPTLDYGGPDSAAAAMSAPFQHAPDKPLPNSFTPVEYASSLVRGGINAVGNTAPVQAALNTPAGQTLTQDVVKPAADIGQAALTVAGGVGLARGALSLARPRLGPSGAPIAEPAPTAAAPPGELGIQTERAEAAGTTGNLTPEQQQARLDLAKRVGIKEVRKSAVEGDAQAAADDYDATKYTGDPIGERMSGVIKGERAAMIKHGEGIVEDSGGTPGLDQTTNKATGKTIAQPFDDLQQHIADTKKAMYTAATEKLGEHGPIDTAPIDAALEDRTLKNSLMAQGKGTFLDSVKDQLAAFKENNGGVLTPVTAERFRQFVNTLWSTDKNAVGHITGAIDEAVGKAVGEDAYAPARAMHGLGKDLLENPDGVRELFERDPKTKINRATSYEDIPDKLTNLDSDQFNNVMDTLDKMPEELQPQAQAAKDAIRAHMSNRLLEAGSKTATQWNKAGVNKELGANSANFERAFAERPDLGDRIKDMRDAGEMLRFNSAYRGAHAQASNMIREGIGLGVQGGGAAIGGTVGTMLGGPGIPTAAGAMAGKAAGSRVMGSVNARAARAAAEKRVVKIP